jgi:cytoskeletal protein CcmA (bactofilin family)
MERRRGAMKKKRLILMGFLAVFLTFALCSLSYGDDGKNFRSGANVKVVADETVTGELVAAGANVEVQGTVEGRLKAFGANIVISGDVQGEVKAFGANVVLAGRYHDKVMAGGSNVTLSGTFDGDVEVGAARVTVARTALIKGNLIHATADLNLQQGSRIMGEVVQKQVMVKKERVEKWGRRGILALFPLGIFFWLISLAALIIVGVIINYLLFPKKTDAIIDTISKSPWKSLWFGLIFLVVVPVAVIIAFVTVVGIPAGIIAGLLYGIAIYISRIYIGVWIGRKILGYINKSMVTAFFWPLVVGVIIIALISLIPVVGWLFRLFVLLISLGALWTVTWKAIPVPVKRRTQRRPQRKPQRKTRRKR